MGRRSSYIVLLLWCVTLTLYVRPSHQFQIDSIGRVVRSHLGTLYDLRSKLGGTSSTTTTSAPTPLRYQHGPDSFAKKESRSGYSFHYSPAEITHPVYSSSSDVLTQDFHSRMGKVSDSVKTYNGDNKWKNPEKYSKYGKYSHKSSHSKEPQLNSFNVHQHSTAYNETTPPELKTTSLPYITSSEPSTIEMSSGLDFSPIKAFGQGINAAMTKVLTEKLMTMLDTEVPDSILKPLKHLVASGNRMVDYWDKRTNARDGKFPGIVEMMGYGLDQLKRFRDGQSLKNTDNVTDFMSASKTLIQGMITVKKLTNRVLGYDTDEDAIESRGGYGHDSYASGGGWGHHVSYGHYLDPYAILATLGFGVFLFNVIFNLLNNNNAGTGRSLDVSDMDLPLSLSDMFSNSNDEQVHCVRDFATVTVRRYLTPSFGLLGSSGGLDPFSLLAALAFGAFLLQLLLTMMNTSARSLDVTDLNTPLMLSDIHMPNFMTAADKIFGTPTVRSKRAVDSEENPFSTIVDKLDGVFKAYQTVTEKPKCSRLYLCRIAVQDTIGGGTGVFSQLYMLGLGHLSKDKSANDFVKSIQKRMEEGEDVNCDNIVKECVPKELKNKY